MTVGNDLGNEVDIARFLPGGLGFLGLRDVGWWPDLDHIAYIGTAESEAAIFPAGNIEIPFDINIDIGRSRNFDESLLLGGVASSFLAHWMAVNNAASPVTGQKLMLQFTWQRWLINKDRPAR